MGGHITALKGMVFADAPTTHQEFHTDALVKLTTTLAAEIEAMFPAGSGDGKTKAKAAVWDKWDDFKAAADKAGAAAEEFGAAMSSGDKGQMAAAFKKLGGSCKGCHDDFRSR